MRAREEREALNVMSTYSNEPKNDCEWSLTKKNGKKVMQDEVKKNITEHKHKKHLVKWSINVLHPKQTLPEYPSTQTNIQRQESPNCTN